MADQKISQMTNASALTGSEVMPLVQNGGNVKATTAAVAALSVNSPRVYAIMTVNTAVAANTWTKIVFDSVNGTFDSVPTFISGTNAVQNSNGTFKPGQTGTYFVIYYLRGNSIASTKEIVARIMRYPNADGTGTGVFQGGYMEKYSSGEASITITGFGVVQISDTNQTIGIEAQHDDTGSKNFIGGNTGGYFSISKLI